MVKQCATADNPATAFSLKTRFDSISLYRLHILEGRLADLFPTFLTGMRHLVGSRVVSPSRQRLKAQDTDWWMGGVVDGWSRRSTYVGRWRSVAPSSALRAPSPPLGRREGLFGFGATKMSRLRHWDGVLAHGDEPVGGRGLVDCWVVDGWAGLGGMGQMAKIEGSSISINALKSGQATVTATTPVLAEYPLSPQPASQRNGAALLREWRELTRIF